MDDGSLFLTMDLVDGESLRSLLDREKVLLPRHGLEIARQTLNGLQSGHEQGFIHRDIKPPNIMLAAKIPKTDENPYGVGVRILDFGIAGLAADVGESKAGTAMYMSPEQVKGERLDARSDLFAVGVMLYEMLSGARPFSGKTTREVMDSVIETNLAGKVAEIEDLSPAVRRILERALQKDREKRFQSAAEFAEAIAKSSAYQVPRVMPMWAFAALGVVAVVALGEGALLMQSDKLDALRLADAAHQQQISEINKSLAEMTKDRDQFKDWKKNREDEDKRSVDKADTSTKLQQQEIDRLKRDLDQQKTDLADTKKLLEDSKNDARKAQDEWRKADELNKQYQQQSSTLAKEATLPVRTARGFDAVLRYVEDDVGRSALSQFNDLADKQGIFAKPDLDGAAFLRSLAEGAAFLQTYRESVAAGKFDGSSLATLGDARARVESAKQSVGSFAAQARTWIGEVQAEGEPTREERARAAVAKLSTEIETATASVGTARSAEWARINSQPATQDPSAAFRLADLYGDDALAPLAQRFVAELRSISTNEKLELDKLAGLGFLGAWADRSTAGHVPLAAADARDLQLYRCAQRWYDNDDTNDDFKLDDAAMGNITEPGKDWRTELCLQWKLGLALTAAKGGRTLVYRQVNSQNEANWWQDKWESSTPGDATHSSWTTKRRITRENAIDVLSDTPVTLERRGKRLMIAGSDAQIVDLRSTGSSVSVAPYPTLWTGDLPPQLGVTKLALEQFRREVGVGPGPCLVMNQGETTRWFSPRFGLVREETRAPAGIIVRELVFASAAP
jgi:serine/threonine protein kinase